MSRAEDFLRERHAEAPGMSSLAFGEGRDANGRSSYARLASLAEAHGVQHVLDLACGDGHLLEEVRARNPAASLHGIDQSPDELALASARLVDAELVEGRVQSLPWPDGSMDLVLCHMALMLFEEIETVLASVANVLCPGGTFSAVVGSNECPNAVLATYRRLWSGLAKADGVNGIAIGDGRTRVPESLEGLVSGTDAFDSVETELFDLHLENHPEDVWASFRNQYNHAWLSPERTAELERSFTDEIRSLVRDDGIVEYGWTFLQVVARRRG